MILASTRARLSSPATHIVYEAAGSPERPDFIAIAGVCWWCGCASPTGRGWPIGRLSDTFQGAEAARSPRSEAVCAPCAWTLGVGFRLPRAYGLERVRIKAEQGRRVDLRLDGDDVKLLIARLDDGAAGLWATAGKRDEEAWLSSLHALRAAPRAVGDCRYLGARPIETLEPGLERFVQAFHHFVVDGVWSVCTDADKPRVRAHLLRDDIVGPAVTSLVTTQGKHTLIHTPVEYPETGTRTVYFGGPVRYRPGELADLLAAVEALRLAGSSQEEMAVGEYAGRDLRWLTAFRRFEPTVAAYRGGRLLDLALYLCRSYPELVAAHSNPVATEIVHARPQPDPDPRGDRAADAAPAPQAGDPASDRRNRPAGPEQLSLF